MNFIIKTYKNSRWRTTQYKVDLDDSIDVRLFRNYINKVHTFDKRIVSWKEINNTIPIKKQKPEDMIYEFCKHGLYLSPCSICVEENISK